MSRNTCANACSAASTSSHTNALPPQVTTAMHWSPIEGGEDHACTIADGGIWRLFEAVTMCAFRQNRHSCDSRKHGDVNRLCRMRVSAELWHVRFSAVKMQPHLPKRSDMSPLLSPNYTPINNIKVPTEHWHASFSDPITGFLKRFCNSSTITSPQHFHSRILL